MRKLFLLLGLCLSLSLFSQPRLMIFWGNGKPCVVIGTENSGGFLLDQENYNYNVIISDTTTGRPFTFQNGQGGRPFTYFLNTERNIWIDYSNWFVVKYMNNTEVQQLYLIETTVNKIRQNLLYRNQFNVDLVIEGLIWRAIHIINDSYNRYLRERYGPLYKSYSYERN